MKVIIFKQINGGVSVIYPTEEVLKSITLEELASKDVQKGQPFKIVDISEIPTDRSYRSSWRWDNNIIPDGVGL